MVPLTNFIYGILGLSFINHKNEGFNWVSRTKLYTALNALAVRYPDQFTGIFFTKRGNLEHSKQIEDALFRLGGVLLTKNLGGQQIGFKDSELKFINQKLEKWLTPQEREMVKKLAEEFYQLVKFRQQGLNYGPHPPGEQLAGFGHPPLPLDYIAEQLEKMDPGAKKAHEMAMKYRKKPDNIK